MAEKMTASEARKDFSGVIDRVAFKGERVTLSRNGKAVAAIVAIEDLKLIEELEDSIDVAIVKERLKNVEPTMTLAEVRKKNKI